MIGNSGLQRKYCWGCKQTLGCCRFMVVGGKMTYFSPMLRGMASVAIGIGVIQPGVLSSCR